MAHSPNLDTIECFQKSSPLFVLTYQLGDTVPLIENGELLFGAYMKKEPPICVSQRLLPRYAQEARSLAVLAAVIEVYDNAYRGDSGGLMIAVCQ